MATIQDVARHAKVGVGTVSRVLSGKGYVKQETREKVLKSIETLNYTPNEMARNLFFRKSGIVAVIVPELSHPLFTQFVNAAEVALGDKGYQTMVCNTYYENINELRYLEMLKRQRVDGIIFGAHTTLDASQYIDIQRPIVALDRNIGKDIPYVASDHKTGGRLAAEALIKSGCKKVLQFGGIRDKDRVSTPSNDRHDMFTKVMEENGIECIPYDIKWEFTSVEYYQKVAEEFLDKYPDADGVFATDMVIMAILQAALARGKKVPEDLKLVCYDGSAMTKLAYPRITTIQQPVTELAEETVELIVDLIDGKPIKNREVQLPVTLIQGDTTTI